MQLTSMKIMRSPRFCLAFVLLAFEASLTSTEGPIWPDTYSIDFHEFMYGPIHKHPVIRDNDGKVWYDYTNLRARYDYYEPQNERLCQGQDLSPDKPDDTCHMIFAASGAMYTHYPNQKTCCKYCEPGMFCTVLFPYWMENATYMGTEMVNDVECQSYAIEGFQTNYWMQTNDGVPCRYSMPLPTDKFPVIHDNKTYVRDTWSLEPIPDSVFEVPEYCETPCPNPLCPPVCPDKKMIQF